VSEPSMAIIASYIPPVSLGRNGHADRAFALAEGYRDFRSLASLCHTDRVFPPQDNPNAVRIQNYMEKFRQEFATELYRWYIEHGS
jgi:nuclear pore complex protein Nup133